MRTAHTPANAWALDSSSTASTCCRFTAGKPSRKSSIKSPHEHHPSESLRGFAVSFSASASTTITQTFTVNTTVPDNNDTGLADYRSISAPGLTEIESITVGLNFTGGWNGDLYAHLVHDSGFSVLLNRPGRTSGNPDGAGSSGMTILLDDSSLSDIHTALANSGHATGTYQPDARTADPLVVTDLSPRSAFLTNFIGLNPNGTWTLFVADQGPGVTSTLQSWTLNITAVPEPSAVLLLLGSSALLLWRRRQ